MENYLTGNDASAVLEKGIWQTCLPNLTWPHCNSLFRVDDKNEIWHMCVPNLTWSHCREIEVQKSIFMQQQKDMEESEEDE